MLNACDHIRVTDYSKAFQAKLAAEMPHLPSEAQKAIIDAGLTRNDVRACRSVH